ncbi:MAG TPA: hypothetical protein VFP85_07975 [Vicinamibacterales bacterium]|nr:hypothetical protein [Vicinamibacterales bacterium]
MRILAVCTLGLLLCACRGAAVNLLNRSSTRLEQVVVTAGGDSVTIEAVEPFGEQTISICPKGEAGVLGLSFKAKGNDYNKDTPLYFECHSSYAIRVEVSAAFEVTAKQEMKY